MKHRGWHRYKKDDPWITYGNYPEAPDVPLFHFVCTRKRCGNKFASLWPFHGTGR